ncbi:acyl-CoA thioesterase [Alkalicoccus urumqiensis]|uniref:Uncharacterized protein n=1 Tax=Alkalicoccus urumqiensis TaxID=1548213 RepID=A0A2P6MDV3_ALKUR|nr:thioesterase family protein [Alkalicoccus urumqiensis]PRO64450.1 hypothetical protein C6I21_14720 [Alkalicoccus urumqiensis]
MEVTVPIDVRYAETDQMGVVYHANYLIWCEIGRTKLMEKMGVPYKEMESSGVMAPVTNVTMNYHAPALYGRPVQITTWVEDYSGVRVTYGYRVELDEETVCLTGTSEHVLVEKDSFRPLAMKRRFPEWHKVYEQCVRISQ